MEYFIIGFLIINFLLTIFLIFKNNTEKTQDKNNKFFLENQKEIQNNLKLYLKDEYGFLKEGLFKTLNDSKERDNKNLAEFKESMINKIDQQMKTINEKVDFKLGEGFKKNQETFVEVVERLSKIDNAQKSMDKLSNEVVNLNNIFNNNKTRGTFGEIHLHHILDSILGENKELYDEQKKLSNGTIADVIINAPEPLGKIVIDSKFPLENYQKMYDHALVESQKLDALKSFKLDIKKHVDDISKKYIILDETANQAIMFIPAEAIFAEIVAKHNDLINYAAAKNVWIASPTTLISSLSIIQTVVRNMKRNENTKIIIEELKKLAIDFDRYIDRWEKLEKIADSLSRDIKNVSLTTIKISERFKQIESGKFDKLIENEE